MQSPAVARLIILIILVTSIVATVSNSIPTDAQSPHDWTEYSSNPVFGQWVGGSKAYYPKVIYDINQFSTHGDKAYYKMWFGSSNGVGYAYSSDGISWTAGPNPVLGLTPGANHPLVKYNPGGFGSGAYYKMWYEDTTVSIYLINTLRYAESSDGVNWTNDQPLTQDSILPLVTNNPGSDWNAGSYGPCDITYNPGGSSSLDDGNLWNNKYVFYYMGTNGNNEYVGLAYSDNATHWKRYGNNPVLGPGAASDWDNTSVGYCSVINSTGIWHMWYGGGPGTNLGIGYATSPDGVSWTKHPYNPIFHVNDGIPWSDNRTYTPWVVYDPANFSGAGNVCTSYKMWYSGKSADEKYSIGYAYITPPAADAGPDQTVTAGSSAVIGGSLTASHGIPPYTYSWTPNTELNDPTLANPTASPAITTAYTVTVIDSSGCSANDTMNLSVQESPPPPLPPIVGGGGFGGLTAELTECPLTLAVNMEGNKTSVSMSSQGVICETCIAKDATGKYVLELDKDTKIALADDVVPLLLRFSKSSAAPTTPDNTVIVGPVYEINAYPASYATIPSPVTMAPPAILTLTYNPKELPDNATEVFIASYDTGQGWLALAPVFGVVAELGKARGLASHFSPVAVLARLSEPKPANFEVSNLVVSPSQIQPDQKVTITVNVTNTGGKSGDYSLQLKVDGIVQPSKQITLAAGRSQTVNFTTTGYAPGKHQVTISTLTGEFDITPLAQPAIPYWWFIGGVVVLISLAVVILVYLRSKNS